MMKVFTAQHPMEAHLIQNLLESKGISAEVRGEALFSTVKGGSFVPDMLPSVWIRHDDQVSQASEIVTRFFKDGLSDLIGESWQCPKCSELLEPQFKQCWKCDTLKPVVRPI